MNDVRLRRKGWPDSHGPCTLRQILVRNLPRSGRLSFRIVFSRPEMDSIRDFLGVSSIRKMRFEGMLVEGGRGVWTLNGNVGATVVQPCVVTLRPVTTRIEDMAVRTFVPDLKMPGANTITVCPDDDTVESLPEVIDLVLIATEGLSLALPDYPRSGEADSECRVRPAGECEADDESGGRYDGHERALDPTSGPFSALSVLKTEG
ncbi:MAG: DUF177 domain-containing protein [Paracoccaceae bacterium]|nr:DUF177 domain-containing protein [Paracoccaceae bacterium]MDE2913187.1 DUF177 domain-containing protein [Paracoccaceae bacterium]